MQPTYSDRFGIFLAAWVAVLGGIAYWKSGSVTALLTLLLIASAMLLVHYAIPSTRQHLFRAFHHVTAPLRWVMTVVLLAMVYYGVVTPIGLLLRMTGRNMRRSNPGDSGWQTRDSAKSVSSYFETH